MLSQNVDGDLMIEKYTIFVFKKVNNFISW